MAQIRYESVAKREEGIKETEIMHGSTPNAFFLTSLVTIQSTPLPNLRNSEARPLLVSLPTVKTVGCPSPIAF